jgi:hypothetical protein
MKALKITILFALLFSLNGFSQNSLSVSLRVEKQAMSTPMTELEEVFFMNYYYARPMNIKFNGSLLNMYYDNGATFAKKEVEQVERFEEYDGSKLAMETFLYVDKQNPSDTISLIVDYNVKYIQVVLPTKNSKGEYIGYTSYRQFVNEEGLALN